MVINFLVASLEDKRADNDKNKETLIEQLYKFQDYAEGWDGLEALPLQPLSVNNLRGAISICDDAVLAGWTLTPETNGTLMLTSNDGMAGINIGDATFSYFQIIDGNVHGESNVPFNPNVVADLIGRIAL